MDAQDRSGNGGRAKLPHDLIPDEGSKLGVLPAPVFRNLRMAYRRLSYATNRKRSPFDVYDHGKIIFIHIPKNAGSFLNNKLYSRYDGDPTAAIAHHSAQYLRRLNARKFKHYPKFAILRNPAARLKSAFNYVKFKSPFEADQNFARDVFSDTDDFDTFLERAQDAAFFSKLTLPHFKPQREYICDRDGRILVDVLLTFENMAEGFAALQNHVSIALPDIEIRDTQHSDVSEAGALEIVEALYPDDFALWRDVQARANSVWKV